MKTMLKIAVVGSALVVMLLADVPLLVPDAHAILGVRRRTAVVAASAGAASAHAADSAQMAQSQQQAAAAQQQAAAAQQQAAAAKQQAAVAAPAPPPAVAGAKLPLGTVVAALPGGCASTPVGGVEYYYCGGNFYRAMFQGNTLVYVTAEPK
jgi:glucose/arabinose dehydrogenase